MKLRIGLTLWIYVTSLFSLVVAAGHLDLALDLYSPLTATHLGPYAPMITQAVVRDAPRYPTYLAAIAAASLLASLYFWRSRRPTETKTFAVTLIAAVNCAMAAVFPAMFYVAYFVVPKLANAA